MEMRLQLETGLYVKDNYGRGSDTQPFENLWAPLRMHALQLKIKLGLFYCSSFLRAACT